MFCPKCGTKQDDDSRFCPNCGADLSEYLDIEEAAEEQGVTDSQGISTEVDGNNKENEDSKIIKPKKRSKSEKKEGTAPSVASASVKNKNKKAMKGIAAIALIAAMVAGVLFGIKNFIGNVSSDEKYVYISDGKYYLSNNLKKDNAIEIAPARTEYDYDNLVRFSPNKKYVYFFSKVESGVGTLYRAEIEKLKKDPVKNEKIIETIASNVQPGINFMRDGSLVYRNGNGSLYYYNGGDPIQIAKNVSEHYTDKDSKIICVERPSDDVSTYSDGSTLYGLDISEPDKIIEMGNDVSYIVSHDDFNNIVFVKTDENEVSALYKAGFDKEKEEKIRSNVEFQGSFGNSVFYTEENGERVKATEFITDTTKDDDTYDFLREELKDDEYSFPLQTLYIVRNGVEEIVAENVLIVRSCGNRVAYITIDIARKHFPKISIEDIWNSNSDIFNDFELADNAIYVSVDNPKDAITLSEKVSDEIVHANPEYDVYPYFYQAGKETYKSISDEGLYVAKIDNNEVTEVENIAEDGYVVKEYEDKLYFFGNEYSTDSAAFGDLYSISAGEKTLVAQGVATDKLKVYDDGSVLAYTDYNYYSDEGSGELNIFSSKGEKKKIGDDVSKFIRLDKNDVVFISDYNLYLFDGKEKSEALKHDVSNVWCSKYEKEKDNIYVGPAY